MLFLRKRLTWKHWLGIAAVVAGLAVVGVSDILFSSHPEGTHTNAEKITGDALILVGMLFTSFQVNIFIKSKFLFIYGRVGCVRRTFHWKI